MIQSLIMKGRIVFLTSLLCLCGVEYARASECTGAGCNLEAARAVQTGAPTVLGMATAPQAVPQTVPAMAQYADQTEFIYVTPTPIPMRSVKTLSIKPVPEDTRPALWDGTKANYRQRGYDKTVDWRDGVPIWDDSIANYKDKDFSDWFLEPSPEIYLREVDTPSQIPTMMQVSTAPDPMQKIALAPAQSVAAPVVVAPAAPCADAAPTQIYTGTTTTDVDPMDLYTQNMMDAAATRARVEELLTPKKPSSDLWLDTTTVSESVQITESVATVQPVATPATTCETPAPAAAPAPVATCATPAPVAQAPVVPAQPIRIPAPKPEYTAQDMTQIVAATFGRTDGCPFDSETECQIWRRKPMIRETVAPRSAQIRPELMEAFIAQLKTGKPVQATDPVAAPLLERYKILMRSAQACCTDGMAYSLKKAGASDGLIYKFLVDDANFYGLGTRCLMTTDAEFDKNYPNTATAAVAADVRNGCLCRGRQWFQAMLAPFRDVYSAAPDFAQSKFDYTYTDGLKRRITVSINNDVQNVLNQLEMCP